jgi:hypothetical protein
MLVVFGAIAGSLLWSVPDQAQSTPGFAILGDSGSDEYRGTDNRGGTYAATTLNWMELLVRYRGFNAGAWGARSEPRRTGYAYNWARSSARTADVISQGQAAGVAAQVADGSVSYALLLVGVNDFSPWNGTYEEIYSGKLTGSALTSKLNAMVNNLRTVIETVQAAGPVTMLVANVPDRGLRLTSQFPDAAGRQRVTNAVITLNAQIAGLASSTGAGLVDYYGFAAEILLQRVDADGFLRVAGEAIDAVGIGNEPHHLILGDNEHAGTVLSGFIANFIVEAMNDHGLNILPFSDAELVANAGIEVDDAVAPAIALTAPANGAAVAGTLTVTANAADNVAVAGVQFKLDGANLGTEDTSAPYSRSWTTTNSQNGAHTLTAVARDAAGNTTTAAAVTVTVSNDDTTAPTVSLTAPSSGATVAGTLTVSASASDNVGVAGVTFMRGGVAIAPEDTASPFSVAVQTSYTQNGSWTLTAVARDAAGNTTVSSSRTITVANPVPDAIAPLVALTSPVAGSTVGGNVSLAATASDNLGVTGVRFRVNGTTVGSEDTSAPYGVTWNTLGAPNGSYTVTATARDAAGNTSTSTAAVTVSNIAQLFQPAAYAVTQGYYQSGTLASLAADDNGYLAVQGTTSGATRYARADFEFLGTPTAPLRYDFTVTARSSHSSTTLRIYAFNNTAGSWTQLTSTSLGTSEITRTVSITSNAAAYRDANGRVRLRVQGSRSGSFTLSLEVVRAAVWK